MKCLLVSFFNSHNLGDCIIADILYDTVSVVYDTEKYSYSGKPATITDINNISKTNTGDVRSKKRYVYKYLKKMKLDFLIRLYKIFKEKSQKLVVFEKKISNVDLLVIGGGNMIFDLDQYSDSAERFYHCVSIANKNNIKVFAISLGIGPFFNIKQEKKACEALSKCDYITFRDRKSYDIYSKNINNLGNVDISVDPVFFLPYKIKAKKNNGITIGVNLLNTRLVNDNIEEYNNIIEEYVELIEHLASKLGVTIILFSTDLSDYDTINHVYDKMSDTANVNIREINGINDLINLYGEIYLLVGMRMHAMIIAFTQHVPVVGISWQQKVEAFFEIIESKDDVFYYKNIKFSSEKIILSCKNKLENLNNEEQRIIKILDKIRKDKNIDKKILRKINN